MSGEKSEDSTLEVEFGAENDEGETDGDEVMPEVSVALSFEKAVERLENPSDAIDSVSMWAEYVGMPSDKPQHVVNGFCSKRDIHIDYFTAPDGGKLDTLEKAMNDMGMDADRHIYVGGSKRDEVIAEKAGWEYMSFEEVADNMNWKIED
ncbi:MAG: hypothetical protein ABEK59_07120 [Halobacteria archaeon]